MPQNKKIVIPKLGDLVQSKQGRDRFRVFLVTELDESEKLAPIVIADGKLHKIGDKKHKNPRHLRVVGHADLPQNDGVGELHTKSKLNALTDVQVYEICKNCNFRSENT